VEIKTELSTGAGAIPILRAWPTPLESCVHGFLGRAGGVSTGTFATLNLSHFVGDETQAVNENWARLRSQVPALEQVVRVNQVHENSVVAVRREPVAIRARADGMVTREAGVMLGIYTADCVPILMIDEKRKIAGALHAGWRGIVADIVGNGVRALMSLGAHPEDIQAALGPSIGPCCFEVDARLGDVFESAIEGSERHTRAGKPGKVHLDLRGIVRDQMLGAGMVESKITAVGPCTKCESERFFSRRAAGGVTTGLQMSFVGFAR
jgi:purine-nucleoside/S-methyl-5'-thioadenosine phosphorylase / adenosine deaminase